MCLRGVSPTNPTALQVAQFGGVNRPLVFDLGQSWRLFTCMWVHYGILHLGVNMWCLWDIGRFLERGFGWKFVLVTYLVAGLFASLLGILVSPMGIGAGASGAILGLYGALLGFLFRHRSAIHPQALIPLRNSALSFVLYTLLFGFLTPGTGNGAHLGGILAGALLGFAKPRQGAS